MTTIGMTSTMTRPSKAQLYKLDLLAQSALRVHGSGVQFDVFDLGKITRAGVEAGLAGASVEEAVKAAIQQYRRN